jgi:hypothetical protein
LAIDAIPVPPNAVAPSLTPTINAAAAAALSTAVMGSRANMM